MLKVYICSPYASQGTIEENVERARKYSRAAVQNKLVPITPHIFFTQFMDDSVDWERQWALEMGLELIEECNFLWVFGIPTGGMIPEIKKAESLGIPITYHDPDGNPYPERRKEQMQQWLKA